MTTPTENNSGGSENIVAAFTDDLGDRYLLFEQTLRAARFFPTLERARLETGKTRAGFAVVIKPNISMMLRRADVGTYTDPFFVIHLLRLLLAEGYTNLALVESGNLYGNWFENRSVIQVAARAGYADASLVDEYRGESRFDLRVRGNGVDALVPLVDVSRETVLHDFDGEAAPVGKCWIEADFRVSLSGLKSHFYSWYTAAIKNIYGCLPEQDKVRAYHCRRKVGPWTARHLLDFPVHFAVVAAYAAADGWMGVKMKAIFAKPHTIIAGADILAVDARCAELIGLAPEKSIMYQCLAAGRPPRPWTATGNAVLFRPWRNVPALLPFISRLMEANADIMDFGGSIATGGNDPCFPVKPSSRGALKRVLFYLSFPISFLCDIGIVKLNFRRRVFYRMLRKAAGRTPFIRRHAFIRERLEYFSYDDLQELIRLAGLQPRNRVAFSGHYLFLDDRETTFRSRFTTTVPAAVEILNYILHHCGLEGLDHLATDLATLLTEQPGFFNEKEPYPYCYR